MQSGGEAKLMILHCKPKKLAWNDEHFHHCGPFLWWVEGAISICHWCNTLWGWFSRVCCIIPRSLLESRCSSLFFLNLLRTLVLARTLRCEQGGRLCCYVVAIARKVSNSNREWVMLLNYPSPSKIGAINSARIELFKSEKINWLDYSAAPRNYILRFVQNADLWSFQFRNLGLYSCRLNSRVVTARICSQFHH